MKKICIILLLFTAKIYSQEILKEDEVYSENNLVYKVENSELFTGKIQSFKGKNHLTYEIEFENGVLKKGIEYFNGKEQIIAEETYYYANNRIVEKKIKYSLDHKTLWITYYNELGEKVLEEDFYENKTIYRCPYLKNKKHGIVFSINKKGVKSECKYENGKLIKN
jgi:hypothetical protein